MANKNMFLIKITDDLCSTIRIFDYEIYQSDIKMISNTPDVFSTGKTKQGHTYAKTFKYNSTEIEMVLLYVFDNISLKELGKDIEEIKSEIRDSQINSEYNNKLERLYDRLANQASNEEEAILLALVNIRGLEQGLIEYYGYCFTDNYDMTIDEIITDLDKYPPLIKGAN